MTESFLWGLIVVGLGLPAYFVAEAILAWGDIDG